ncbi:MULTISPECIES: methyltransferase [Streptomyces]|uniref:Ribosomal RNA large subunit methyltransferase G n=2 Tax=Streptomyces avermitilis TaxID=33903 RepID=RLMG_STRAW|nr:MULTISPECIES: methyltransferase [Streptomyces]Q82N59.1 RecName: Full=Ribosomal RNA large subunit methyltransferase G; AltName: Full=23S rRNA m2G1835 methyltransferase; AltName: Full=rRNA (guanine-N(2)-)-methyltransferase RlmG [Streptomyces avermitilis MA-4680 = NBRC 14893]BAC69154.1 putative ribosomal RNA small subunit methyltransferase [Streptomyces avermitilis MA-4680 = NBRC 14893]BBJ49107.1 ribosomal RNA large subunit methyltransferase G [Streptomyces avermitilis]GDY61148.1 ribosomal RNA 
MNDPMTTPWGAYALARFPEDPRDRLRAWDASDAYLLRHLAASGTPLSGSVVVLGDRWGALTTALAAHRPTQITDSFLAREATRENLGRAGVDPSSVRLLTTRDTPPERIDVLLVRVPKSLALLEDQLHRLAPGVHEGTVVVGAGMVKEIHTSTLKLFERILGPTRTSLAEQKARLIFCTPDPGLVRDPNPWPYRYRLPDGVGPLSGRPVTNHAGVFCADRLDIGTRFFLRHLPRVSGAERVVDLGCGNGVVGTAVALTEPEAEVLFVDESYQAVASARETFRANADGTAEFLVGDGLSGVPAASVDVVLNNPPFHSHQATTDATAWRMFTGAKRALRPGGELWVIGNRHLGYHLKLRRLFGNSELVASDAKFVVLRAVKK